VTVADFWETQVFSSIPFVSGVVRVMVPKQWTVATLRKATDIFKFPGSHSDLCQGAQTTNIEFLKLLINVRYFSWSRG